MNKYFFILLLILSNTVYAGDYYSDHAVGWHWYGDPKENSVKNPAQAASPVSNPNEVVKSAREKINTALNQVIVIP